MGGTDVFIALGGLWLTTIAMTAGTTMYLSSQINKKLPTEDYERKHETLAERVRRLELWAAKKNDPDI